MKVDILAIGAHPDDVELSASGTLLRHIAQGKTVGLLDLTRGELGSRGSAELRDLEAAESAKKMGALFRKNLALKDGFFEHNEESLRKIITVIRWCRPGTVLANSPKDRHPDHGRASKLVADACFYAGLAKVETEGEDGALQQHWRPQSLFFYIQDRDLKPDFVVDISAHIEQKMELVLTFRSQFYLPTAKEFENELATPISGKDFLDFLRAKNRSFGRPIGVEYAEGFVNSRAVGVDDLFRLR